MSKEADLIQVYNDEKREYEYFVKGFDVTESIRVLLKAHKEAYDKERRVFAECKGYCDAEKEFKERIADLEAKLAESQNCACKHIAELTKIATKKDRKIEELKQQLAEKEKEVEQLNNRILISQLQAPEEQRLKIIGSSCCQYNPKRDKISFAVEKLEEMKKFFLEEHKDEEMDTDYIITKDAGQIADYLLDQIKQLKKEMK